MATRKVHMAAFMSGALAKYTPQCGLRPSRWLDITTDPSKVTCRNCKMAMRGFILVPKIFP